MKLVFQMTVERTEGFIPENEIDFVRLECEDKNAEKIAKIIKEKFKDDISFNFVPDLDIQLNIKQNNVFKEGKMIKGGVNNEPINPRPNTKISAMPIERHQD